jgi:hypothetical protein
MRAAAVANAGALPKYFIYFFAQLLRRVCKYLNSIFFHQYFFYVCKRIYVAVDTMISFLHARHIATNNTNDIIAQNTPLHRKKIIQLICIPLCVASLLGLLSVIFLKNQIPQNMDSEKWKQFAISIQQSLHAEKNRFIIVLAIVLVNVLQTVFAFPLLHVTKVLSGYMFGFVSGFLLCVSVEMICVVIVVCLCEKIQTTNDALPSNVRKYFESMRSSWHMFFVLVCLQRRCFGNSAKLAQTSPPRTAQHSPRRGERGGGVRWCLPVRTSQFQKTGR